MRPRWCLAFVVLAGCAEDDELTARIELVDGGGCDAKQLEQIRTLSVSVYGRATDDDQACLLNRACASPTRALQSVEDVAAALRDEDQPVIDDAVLDDAAFVAILGHDSLSCGFFAEEEEVDDPRLPTLCGFIDVAQLDDGHAEVSMTCEACERTPVEQCE